MTRRHRIAMSTLSGAVFLLFTLLWLRSFWLLDTVTDFDISSVRGWLFVWRAFRSSSGFAIFTQEVPGSDWWPEDTALAIPIWLIAVPAAWLAIVPWLQEPRRGQAQMVFCIIVTALVAFELFR